MTFGAFILLGLCFVGSGGDPKDFLPNDSYTVTEIRTKKTTKSRTVERYKKVTKRTTTNSSNAVPL